MAGDDKGLQTSCFTIIYSPLIYELDAFSQVHPC